MTASWKPSPSLETAEKTLLLIDERPGRREAKRLGLEIIGTLGVLQQAHDRGLLNIREAIDQLKTTNFSATESLFDKFTDRA